MQLSLEIETKQFLKGIWTENMQFLAFDFCKFCM